MYRKIGIIITSILLCFFVMRIIINEAIICFYNNEVYLESFSNSLYVLNINEPYIAYYNKGNILYMKAEYEEAESSYKKALDNNPTSDRVCDIRINLVLSLIAQIEGSNSSKISQLENAKNYLYEDGCANDYDDNGKSEEAEELEDQIEEMEEELSNDTSSDDNNSDDSEVTKNYDNVEDTLKESSSEAYSSRQSDLDQSKNYGNYEYYSGKSW